MSLIDTDITEIVQEVWSAMLGLDVEPAWIPEPAAEPDAEHVTGSVTVTGAADCVVALQLRHDAARVFAAAMFGMEADEVGEDEVADAIGELTNMVGGNIKSLLPEPSWLSLPAVSGGRALVRVPGAEATNAVALQSADQRILVRVWSRPEGAGECPLVEAASAS
jgi:chemotaxis protein CheX